MEGFIDASFHRLPIACGDRARGLQGVKFAAHVAGLGGLVR